MRFRPLVRAAVVGAILLPALGCLPTPTDGGKPQTVQVENAATVPARVRVGPFKAGTSDVPEDSMIAEQIIPSKVRAAFSIPAGRYNIEAVAITQKAETATTNFSLAADRPVALQLHEALVDNFERVSPSASPQPVQQAERLRQLSWIEL